MDKKRRDEKVKKQIVKIEILTPLKFARSFIILNLGRQENAGAFVREIRKNYYSPSL